MTASRYRHRGTWRKVEDNGVGREELLVAGDNERSGEVHGRMRPVPKTQELNRGTGGQTNAQLYTRKTMEAHQC